MGMGLQHFYIFNLVKIMGKKPLELLGKKIGHLTVIKQVDNQNGHTRWLCQCDCGGQKIFQGSFLKKGDATSCGCKHGCGSPREYLKSKITVNPNTGCWEWMAGKHNGYGRAKWKNKQWIAHRFSYFVFKDPTITPKEQIQHLCNNPSCINPDHLQSGSPKENSLYCVECNRQVKGNKVRLSKLKESDINTIRKMRANNIKYLDIAKKYGVDVTTIESIIYGKTWKHVPLPKGYRYEKKKPETITEKEVIEIKKLLFNGVRNKDIAKQFHISKYIVHQIKYGRTWKYVPWPTRESSSSK